jgi:hypothetical protein
MAELEARRAQIDGADDLRRAELIFVFDERTGEPLDVLFRTESRRRIKQPHDARRAIMATSLR